MAARWFVLALISWLLSSTGLASPNHDELQARSPMHVSRQSYGVTRKERRLTALSCEDVHTSAQWEPIRIGFEVLDVESVAASSVTDSEDLWRLAYVRDVLMPRSVSYLQQALNVRRASAPLRADRIGSGCSKYPFETSYTCTGAAAPTCGSDNIQIPDVYLNSFKVCSTRCSPTMGCSGACVVDGQCSCDFTQWANQGDSYCCVESPSAWSAQAGCPGDCSPSTIIDVGGGNGVCESCTTMPAGAGALDSDFFAFVTIRDTASCGGATQAYASSCVRDQCDRPIFGSVNFCRSKLTHSVNAWVSTTIHELVHTMVFSSSLFRYFRYTNGTAKFARDESDKVAAEVRWSCASSSSFTYPDAGGSRYYVDLSTAGVIGKFAERGLDSCPCPVGTSVMGSGCIVPQSGMRTPTCVFKLTTPRVIEKTREYFNCSSLQGAELENQDTSECVIIGSHWEQRIFMKEIMAPVSVGDADSIIFSEVTLALFEDSGWYKPDYSMADTLVKGVNFGYKQGCAFALNRCVSADNTAYPRHWCTSNGQRACSMDRRSVQACTVNTFSPVPTAVSYFTVDNLIGSVPEADYCPFHHASVSNRVCTTTSSLFGPVSNVNFMREVFGSNSFCLESTLHADVAADGGTYVANPSDFASPIPGCFQIVCSDASYIVYIASETSPFVEAIGTCTAAGQLLTTSALSGQVTCADPGEICLTPTVMHYERWNATIEETFTTTATTKTFTTTSTNLTTTTVTTTNTTSTSITTTIKTTLSTTNATTSTTTNTTKSFIALVVNSTTTTNTTVTTTTTTVTYTSTNTTTNTPKVTEYYCFAKEVLAGVTTTRTTTISTGNATSEGTTTSIGSGTTSTSTSTTSEDLSLWQPVHSRYELGEDKDGTCWWADCMSEDPLEDLAPTPFISREEVMQYCGVRCSSLSRCAGFTYVATEQKCYYRTRARCVKDYRCYASLNNGTVSYERYYAPTTTPENNSTITMTSINTSTSTSTNSSTSTNTTATTTTTTSSTTTTRNESNLTIVTTVTTTTATTITSTNITTTTNTTTANSTTMTTNTTLRSIRLTAAPYYPPYIIKFALTDGYECPWIDCLGEVEYALPIADWLVEKTVTTHISPSDVLSICGGYCDNATDCFGFTYDTRYETCAYRNRASCIRTTSKLVTTVTSTTSTNTTTTSTSTSTTQTTSSTTSNTTTTTTIAPPRIAGVIVLIVSNVAGFIADPGVEAALISTIADITGLPNVYVSVVMVLQTRRLSASVKGYERSLQAGTVLVNYEVIAADTGTDSIERELSQLIQSIMATSAQNMRTSIIGKIAQQGDTVYAVTVNTIEAPVVKGFSTTSTTTTTTSAPPTTPPPPTTTTTSRTSTSTMAWQRTLPPTTTTATGRTTSTLPSFYVSGFSDLTVQDLEGPEAPKFMSDFSHYGILESALAATVYGLTPTMVNVFHLNHTNYVSLASHPRNADPPRIRVHFIITVAGEKQLNDVLVQLEYVSMAALDWQVARSMADAGVPTSYSVVMLYFSRLQQIYDPQAYIGSFGTGNSPTNITPTTSVARRANFCVRLWWFYGLLAFTTFPFYLR